MLDSKALANASALVTVVIYIICVVLALVAPDLLFSLLSLSWHTVNTELLRDTQSNLNAANVVLGAIVSTVLVWVTIYSVASVYNKLRRK